MSSLRRDAQETALASYGNQEAEEFVLLGLHKEVQMYSEVFLALVKTLHGSSVHS